MRKNYEQLMRESARFLSVTILCAVSGFFVVILGVSLLYLGLSTSGIVTSVASFIPEMIAVMFFAKDQQLRRQISEHHSYLVHSQTFITAMD
jgi:hypothetical protein